MCKESLFEMEVRQLGIDAQELQDGLPPADAVDVVKV